MKTQGCSSRGKQAQRSASLLKVALCLGVLTASSVCAATIWAGLDTGSPDPRSPAATLSESQQEAVRQAIHSHAKLDGLEQCDEIEPNGAWLQKIVFETIAVAELRHVVLAEAGMGCARGGQGANGAMWIVALDGAKPVLLATPQDGFNGWLYAVQPLKSQGYHDVVLGWHWSASETGLTYFRFHGGAYRCIGGADRSVDRDTGKTQFDTHAGCKHLAAWKG